MVAKYGKIRMINRKNEEFYVMALAYLDIGIACAKENNSTQAYQNAVAYQLYHALELFTKYAISKKDIKFKKVHDLGELFEQYRNLYPETTYNIDHPFDFTSYDSCDRNKNEQELYEAHVAKFQPKIMDQHLRYPSDNITGGYSYKIDSDFFTKIKDKLESIHSQINI